MNKQKNRIFFLGFIVFCLLFSIPTVSARMLTIEEVIEEFQNSKEIKEANQRGDTIEAKNNEVDKTLDIYSKQQKVASFPYDQSYIQFTLKEMDESEQIIYLAYASYVINSLFSLSDTNSTTLKDELQSIVTDEKNFETYGLYVHLDQKNEFDEIKISLDTDKISALMKESEIVNDSDANKTPSDSSTLENSKENDTVLTDKDGNVVENPQTGSFISLGVAVLLGIIALALLKFSKRKSVLHKL